MGSENQINKVIALFQFFHYLRLLHHTAAQSNHHMRIFLFRPSQLSQAAVYSQVCIFPDCTCIINHKICFFFLLCLLITDFFQNTGKFFRISGIHLAAEGRNTESKRPSCLFLHFFQMFSCSLYKIILSFRFRCRDLRIQFVRLNSAFFHSSFP